jgi:hypothetical protein
MISMYINYTSVKINVINLKGIATISTSDDPKSLLN